MIHDSIYAESIIFNCPSYDNYIMTIRNIVPIWWILLPWLSLGPDFTLIDFIRRPSLWGMHFRVSSISTSFHWFGRGRGGRACMTKYPVGFIHNGKKFVSSNFLIWNWFSFWFLNTPKLLRLHRETILNSLECLQTLHLLDDRQTVLKLLCQQFMLQLTHCDFPAHTKVNREICVDLLSAMQSFIHLKSSSLWSHLQ